MEETNSSNCNISDHHVQQDVCTTRLPYRQGRKLTAVKVYSVVNESQHLLIFGVPALNLRSELKALCLRYGTLKTFAQSPSHSELCEPFTECYRVSYDRIQSSRVAKRQMDVKNFYGGSLHVCYAPELEELSETRTKIMQRRRDIAFRLRNNQEVIKNKTMIANSNANMRESNENIGNTIKDIHKSNLLQERTKTNNPYSENEDILKHQPIKMKIVYTKQYKPCFIEDLTKKQFISNPVNSYVREQNESILSQDVGKDDLKSEKDLDETQESRKRVYDDITNGESYREFGNEIIKKVVSKKMNRIVFPIKKV